MGNRRLALTLGGLDSNLLETFRLFHGPHNSLHQFLYLFVQATNVTVLLSWLLIDFHSFDAGVIFGGESIEDQVRVFVHTNEVTGLQFIGVHQTNQWQEDGLSCRGFDDGRLANSRRVQVNVCALL